MRAIAGIVLIGIAGSLQAQTAPDPSLLAEINAIKAIDHHAHPSPALPPGAQDDQATVSDSVPPLAPPALLRMSNPQWVTAWRELYAYVAPGAVPDKAKLLAAKNAFKKAHGTHYPRWVLDKLGIDIMLTNRYTLGPGLESPRFRLVWYADPLLFPLDNETGKAANPQKREEFTNAEKWLKRYLADAKTNTLPPTLDGYIAQVIIPLLAQKKKSGAVAVKFATAYMRALDFGNPSVEEASGVYAQYVRGGAPPAADYKKLQDYLFRRISQECGRVGLPVHIHVGAGAGPFFDNSGSDPFLLLPTILDPAMRPTTFVLIHGGFPNASASRVLFAKPNVYVDFSSQGFLSSTRELSQVLRSWIEFRPDKVMFGTDAYSLTPYLGWEEVGWLTNTSGRRALALALTGMIQDREITRARASEIARMVMHDNAAELYGLK
ncbi:MAG TPA: amidohydrolase family protein [Gemmatimonadaceae bacterium]|jgi:predicted TIM-barrel fold metal-dependent hydrolase|nr:amidohydrolase family protein [Gemmatimonadaceae bacterium]